MYDRKTTGWLALLVAGGLIIGCGNGSEPEDGANGDMGEQKDAPANGSAAKDASEDSNGDSTGDSAASEAYPEADTPRQAVLNLADALQTGDEDAFMRVVHNADQRKKLARAVFHFGHATTTVRDAVRDLHGEAGLEILDQQEDFGLPYPLGDDAWRDQLTIRETAADRAEARIGDEDGDPLVLRKVDERWRVDLLGALDAKTDAQIERARAAMETMADRMDDLRDRIESAGLSAQRVAEELKNDLSDSFTRGRRWLADVIAPDEAPDGGSGSE